MVEIIEKLKISPMYNLSLSSKELFHSNFLSWLGTCEETKRLFEYVIQELSEQKDFNLNDKRIEREKHNFDLSIESNGVTEIVIENKVKSFPKLTQLREYEKKVKEIQKETPCTFILLSLFTTTKEIKPWITKSYKNLADALKEKTEEYITHSYYKEIIKDYTAFIYNLHKISELTKLEEGEPYSYTKVSDKESGEKTIYEACKEIRFEDFFLKAKYAQIAEKIHEKLSDTVAFKVKQDFDIKKIMAEKSAIGTIYINHGFTRADGIIEVKIRAKDFVYLIQIQGDSYRRGFENYEKKKKMPPVLSDEEKNWVNFSDVANTDNEIEVYPSKEGKDYNQYGDNFKYKSFKISATKWNTTQLIAQIMEDIKKCVSFIVNN